MRRTNYWLSDGLDQIRFSNEKFLGILQSPNIILSEELYSRYHINEAIIVEEGEELPDEPTVVICWFISGLHGKDLVYELLSEYDPDLLDIEPVKERTGGALNPDVEDYAAYAAMYHQLLRRLIGLQNLMSLVSDVTRNKRGDNFKTTLPSLDGLVKVGFEKGRLVSEGGETTSILFNASDDLNFGQQVSAVRTTASDITGEGDDFASTAVAITFKVKGTVEEGLAFAMKARHLVRNMDALNESNFLYKYDDQGCLTDVLFYNDNEEQWQPSIEVASENHEFYRIEDAIAGGKQIDYWSRKAYEEAQKSI